MPLPTQLSANGVGAEAGWVVHLTYRSLLKEARLTVHTLAG